MIAIIDNYDSFTYNLVQYFGELGQNVRVFRNDQITVSALAALNPEAIVISPGPGSPENDSGISNELLATLSGRVPIFGVCLGQQCMGHVFGGQVTRAELPMHGKVSQVRHNGTGVFAGLPNPFTATRYHSLVVMEPLPTALVADAHSIDDDECMGLHHSEHPTYGVQFHPESILTEGGKQILQNFLNIAREWHKTRVKEGQN